MFISKVSRALATATPLLVRRNAHLVFVDRLMPGAKGAQPAFKPMSTSEALGMNM
jgi:hypothetical protein